MRKLLTVLASLSLLLSQCGNKSGPTIQFSMVTSISDPFNDPNAKIVRFKIFSENLDSDGQGGFDVYGYPDSCIEPATQLFKAGCGYSLDKQTYNLSGVPFDPEQPIKYHVRAEFLNAADQIIYWGESDSFDNIQRDSPIIIVINAGSP